MGANLDQLFRLEAREILEELTRDLLDLEKEPGRADLVARCFRLAHTLKGAARAVRRTQIGDLAHTVEEALAAHRDGGEALHEGRVSDLLQILDLIRSEVEGLSAAEPTAAKPSAHEEQAAGRFETVRVKIAEMDALLEGVSETHVLLGPLRSGADALAQAHRVAGVILERMRGAGSSVDAKLRASLDELRTALAHAHRDVGSSLAGLERELGEVRNRAARLRLVPVDVVFGALELAARDAAQMLGKSVEFEASGGDIRLEGHILAAVRDALIHAVRNAVDHGIEAERDRLAAGKRPAGRVQLVVERRGRRVAFLCRDDGRGIDVEAVRRAAVERRVIAAEEAAPLGIDEVLRLAFEAGVSTSDGATQISGRGVGLDVVHDTVVRLEGEARIESDPGRGTTLVMEVPVSLSSLPVLVVSAAGHSFLIPLDAVRGALRLTADDIARGAGGDTIVYEGHAIPFVPLSKLGGVRAPAASARPRWSAVVIQSGARWMAVGVDRLLGTAEVMIKPLPPFSGAPAAVAGAAFDAHGDPLLVLDPRGLLRGPTALSDAEDEAPAPRLPILVIDDSLTTRMLEQSILESNGYEVDVAASAEEGLEKARKRRYGLFICDVEMPGMNGFEFTAETRADPVLREVPVIMVTSLASAAHRQRAAEAGASAYIVKGEFDQKHFIRNVVELYR